MSNLRHAMRFVYDRGQYEGIFSEPHYGSSYNLLEPVYRTFILVLSRTGMFFITNVERSRGRFGTR